MAYQTFEYSSYQHILRELNHEADLYAILRSVEKLENLFVSGHLKPDLYETACLKIISQFKLVYPPIKEKYGDVQNFFDKYNLYCPLAKIRLIDEGVPANTNIKNKSSKKNASLIAFELSGQFITLTDSLRLGEKAIDSVLPLLKDVISSLSSVESLNSSLYGGDILLEWRSKLSQMKAFEELTDEDTRQLILDVETAYSGFKNWLEHNH